MQRVAQVMSERLASSQMRLLDLYGNIGISGAESR
jgi:hypothetical protein